MLPTEGAGAGAEQGSETSQGLLGARTPRAGSVLRAGPEAQLSWDTTVAVLCTRAGSSLPPSGSLREAEAVSLPPELERLVHSARPAGLVGKRVCINGMQGM